MPVTPRLLTDFVSSASSYLALASLFKLVLSIFPIANIGIESIM